MISRGNLEALERVFLPIALCIALGVTRDGKFNEDTINRAATAFATKVSGIFGYMFLIYVDFFFLRTNTFI